MAALPDCATCSSSHGQSGSSTAAPVPGACPPRMADGRHFTDYRPRCMANFLMHNDTLNSFEYRQYLIKNAETVMKKNSIAAYETNACGPCVEPYDVGTMLPEQYQVSCGASTCKITLNDQAGLGTGRTYSTQPTQQGTEARAAFLRNKDNEQAYFKNAANSCAGSGSRPDATLQFSGYRPEEFQRHAVPSGAPLG